jgi:hypothetical protein
MRGLAIQKSRALHLSITSGGKRKQFDNSTFTGSRLPSGYPNSGNRSAAGPSSERSASVSASLPVPLSA